MRILLLAALAAAPLAAQDPAEIRLDQPASGTLAADDPTLEDGSHYDLWVYRGTAGERVRIDLRSTAFDCYLSAGVLDEGAFTVRASNDDVEPGNTDARVDVTVPEGGVLHIRVNSFDAGETGAYTLALGAGPPAAAFTVQEIAPATVAGGEFAEGDATRDNGAPAHFWRFTAEPGARYAILLYSGEVDTFLEVGQGEGEAFAAVQTSDDVDNGTDSRILFDAAEGGTWIIRASTFGPGETGPYRLAIQRLDASR